MGEVRSGTGRSGAQALPLTRRQQRRARQQQSQLPARRQNQQRPPQPPQPTQPLQRIAPEQSTEREKPTTATPATGAPVPTTLKPPRSKRPTRTPGATRSTQAPVPAEAAPAPANVTRLRAKTGAPTPARRSAGAARTLKSAASAASGRKYPTLARMVAVTSHPEMQVIAATEGTGDTAQGTPHLAPEQDGERRLELLETQPVPALDPVPNAPDTPDTPARRAVPTHRLTPLDRQTHAHADGDTGADVTVPGAGDSTPHPASASGVRPLPLPEPDLVVPVAAAHAGLAAAAALTGAAMLIAGTGYSLWPFTLAASVGAGGWLGYIVAGRSRRLAALLLLLAQVGALAWLLALLGARGAILALVPALALLALRWLGRTAAYALSLSALALYALAALLQISGALVAPVALPAGSAALLDGGFAVVGLLAMLLLVGGMHRAQLRAELAAQARRHEVRILRARLGHLRAQVEDDAARLDGALARVLAGRGPAAPVETDGLLSPLAETTNAAAERLATLQRDREDRLRLEGAVRTVTRVVERAWLGLPWSWPEWSGTALDELVALLRTPRPQEIQADWSEETPTLAAIPTGERAGERGMTPRPWERPTPTPTPVNTVRAAWSQALDGTSGTNGTNGHVPALHVVPSPGGERAPSALLPWHEWDTWSEWAAAVREE